MKLIRPSLFLLLLGATSLTGCGDEEDDGAVPNGVSVKPAVPVEPYGGLVPAGAASPNDNAGPAPTESMTAPDASAMPSTATDTVAGQQ